MPIRAVWVSGQYARTMDQQCRLVEVTSDKVLLRVFQGT